MAWAVNALEQRLVSDEVDVGVLLCHVRYVSLGLVYPVCELDFVVDRAQQVQVRERVNQHVGRQFIRHWKQPMFKKFSAQLKNGL